MKYGDVIVEEQNIMITEYLTGINYIENLFSTAELEEINLYINDSKQIVNDTDLGRLKITLDKISNDKFIENLEYKASHLVKKDMVLSHIMYVEYSNKSGQPNLPPHFDGDTNSLVFDYQLESNTSWDLGLGTKTYPLIDNSALIFNANKNIHWRPYKDFKDGEYIKMVFFRFYDKHNRIDYTHLNYRQDHPIFQDVRDYRESLRNQ